MIDLIDEALEKNPDLQVRRGGGGERGGGERKGERKRETSEKREGKEQRKELFWLRCIWGGGLMLHI